MPTTVILGTGRALPERVVTNDDLAALMDTSDEWIRTRTGIEERHWIAPGETGVGLALTAARQALAMAAVEPAELDAIVYSSSTPDQFIPGNGVLLQDRLGARTIPAIDLRMQCAGFIYALAVADSFIRLGTCRKVLVVGQEIQSTRMDVSTRGRGTAVIFADGAGAALVAATEEPGRGILAVDLGSDGAHAETLWVPEPGAIWSPMIDAKRYAEGRYFLQMDGKEVFRHAVERMPASVRTCLDRAGLAPGDLDLLIPHQANARITDAVQRALGLRDDQVYGNIARYGNTTSASIPIALDECVRAERLAPGALVAFSAFGSGFVWGSVLLRW